MFSQELSELPCKSAVRTNSKILLLETEELFRDMLTLALEEQDYEVVIAPDVRSVIPYLENSLLAKPRQSFNLLILDSTNGLDICRMLRHQGNLIPIMILGAKGSANNCAFYLEAGADDYVTKPFGMREFMARCYALMRRQNLGKSPQPVMLQYKEIILYPEECRVTVRGEDVKLSPKQFRLLELFMSYPRRVWSREQLLEQVWGPDFIGDSKTVDVHIRWLREKLEINPSKCEYVITVRGFGYRFG
ncbi:response regulator transcription factor [Okeania sp.]|uniref:response regulator transcription factor n=1 Tax=Okeania sp. TaxID=3100323 RepID=UPI002B4ACA2F|nr:response regulator transcription factor [Okeania sp.]MEB3340423.1 response regulator transcription factor [Okeania sp.]